MTEINDLVNAKGGAFTLPIGEKRINLAKLSPGDIADAGEFLIRQRYARAEAGTGTMPITIEARAKMLSDIACAPISIADVMDDPMGRLKLIELGAKRAKNQISFEAIKASLSGQPQHILTKAVLWLLHYEVVENDAANPPSEGTTAA